MSQIIKDLGQMSETVWLEPQTKKQAFNVWLALLDELLDKKIPIANAMVFAGQRLQEMQKKQGGNLFHPVDLYVSCENVNLLLRRRPEYQQREKGWAKDN
jgi:hypothetical protein